MAVHARPTFWKKIAPKADPGRIEDFTEHSRYLQQRYKDFIRMFFDLGGQNMILTAYSFRGFTGRGEEYGILVNKEMMRLIDDDFQAFYREHDIDPYFVGIDTYLHLPEGGPAHQLAQSYQEFQRTWPYDSRRKRLIWEIASIPLFSFWQMFQKMTPETRAQVDAKIAGVTNLDDIHRIMYEHFAREMYGVDVPMPHFYLGTNKSGDLKWRSPMPISLTGGEYMRLFYTPYPSLFITPQRCTPSSMIWPLASAFTRPKPIIRPLYVRIGTARVRAHRNTSPGSGHNSRLFTQDRHTGLDLLSVISKFKDRSLDESNPKKNASRHAYRRSRSASQ
ncbi:hypothetical protein HC776_00435 [bacterium]|nr:hypothetical protein [bacterium]